MLTAQEREYLLSSMEDLLDEYDYDYTPTALSKIIDEWVEAKSKLIQAFKKHPNTVMVIVPAIMPIKAFFFDFFFL